MFGVRIWLGVLLAVCGVAYAVVALLGALQDQGDVDIVRSWTEFGLGVAMAGCGLGMALLLRREARKAATRGDS
jgi:hypothetical protein